MLDHLLGRTEASDSYSATSVHRTSPQKMINGAILDTQPQTSNIKGEEFAAILFNR